MIALLNRIIHAGTDYEISPEETHNIKLINGLCLIAISTTLISMLITISEVYYSQLVFASVLSGFFSFIIYLNYKGLNVKATHIFLWLSILGIGIASIMNAYEAYIFLYLMPVSLIPIMVFKNCRCRYVYFGMALGLILGIKIYHDYYEPLIYQKEIFAQNQQYVSLILSNLCNFYLLIFFKRTNLEYEQRLEKDRFYTHDLLIKTQNVNHELQGLNRKLQISEDESRQKATHLEEANHELQSLNYKLQESEEELRQKATHLAKANYELETMQTHLEETLKNLKDAQAQLVQSEKMVSLGQLTAGIAHELNNPINFVYAGTNALEISISDIKEILEAYESVTTENTAEKLQEIEELKEELEIEETQEELSEMLNNIKNGAKRTAEIVRGLQTFSRLDENDIKAVDLHENIDSTLIILRNQYKDRIEVIRNYGKIPQIECLPGKINQVFMNILANAVQSIKNKGQITISTIIYQHENTGKSIDFVKISIKDSGSGIPKPIQNKIFDPFFTTKDVGEGTGLGLSISHGIIQKHQGKIELFTEVGKGTEFVIHLPVHQTDTDNILR